MYCFLDFCEKAPCIKEMNQDKIEVDPIEQDQVESSTNVYMYACMNESRA